MTCGCAVAADWTITAGRAVGSPRASNAPASAAGLLTCHPITATAANDAAIAHTIIMLADTLGLHVIAEGVETEAHHAFLKSQGCRAFQGYLFGRPESLTAFELRTRSSGALPAAA